MMGIFDFQSWFGKDMIMTMVAIVILSILLFLITRNVIVRLLIHFASRSTNKIDDILVNKLHPYRMAWLAPLVFIYLMAGFFPDYQTYLEKATLFLILWLSVATLNGLLNAVNDIYESRATYSGVSIQGYLDIAKILIALVGVILSISLLSNESPVVLLTGLGALTAVLLLIFQDTILSLVASVQIASQNLIKEGDWIEVPSYEADGDVVNVSLNTIKVRNFDMTYTMIPTSKIVEVAYKNWRGMKESGGRRIERSILIDMNSMKFCDDNLLKNLSKIDLIKDYLDQRILSIKDYQKENADHYDSPLDGPQITNTEVYRYYIISYLKNRQDIHQQGMPFLVRSLEPKPTGLPIEMYIFTKTTVWEEYEAIQSEIFDHLLAAATLFELRIFQEPTGMDFTNFSGDLIHRNG
ncbi:MAG: mechanosensitive ion channel domain-containing protein [Anaerolineaceae bacterium]